MEIKMIKNGRLLYKKAVISHKKENTDKIVVQFDVNSI